MKFREFKLDKSKTQMKNNLFTTEYTEYTERKKPKNRLQIKRDTFAIRQQDRLGLDLCKPKRSEK